MAFFLNFHFIRVGRGWSEGCVPTKNSFSHPMLCTSCQHYTSNPGAPQQGKQLYKHSKLVFTNDIYTHKNSKNVIASHTGAFTGYTHINHYFNRIDPISFSQTLKKITRIKMLRPQLKES